MKVNEKAFWPVPMAINSNKPSEAQEKATKVREGLKDLRRVKKVHSAADAEAAAGAEDQAEPEEAKKDDEQDEALIYATLRDLEDTVDSLQALEEQLQEGLNPIKENGGARHATAVISGRTLAVVQRKKSLLITVTARLNKLEELQGEFDALLAALDSGEASEAPAELRGIKKFVDKYTHSPGEPADANKSDFKGFVSSFKLPYWHSALSTLRTMCNDIGEWWADACLQKAEEGSDHYSLERLFDVAIGTGLERDHPKLRKARAILNDRLATRVLREAQDFLEKDTLLEERQKASGRAPPVGPAATAADSIEDSILKAVADGCSEEDKRLKEAKGIVKTLRENDGSRKRLANREAKMAKEAADKKAAELAAEKKAAEEAATKAAAEAAAAV